MGFIPFGASGTASASPQPADMGYSGWTYDTVDITTSAGSILSTAGVLYLSKIPLRAAEPVSNIDIYLQTAGVTLTASQCFAGIYDSTGALVATSADQSTAWVGSAGRLTMALAGAAPFTVDPPFVWVALVFNGTTGPKFAVSAASSNALANGQTTAAATRYGSVSSGNTALPASFTPASISKVSAQWWAAVW